MKSTKRTISSSRRIQALAAMTALLFALTALATAQTETILYSFNGGADGETPLSGVVRDAAGNLYGTTYHGGLASMDCATTCGTVFELAPTGTKTVIHTFTGPPDGANPEGSLVRDLKGNLYGTTVWGGKYSAGTVYKISPTGVEKVLYSFTRGGDGGAPYAGLVYAEGNLYGTTANGGAAQGGTVFKLTPDGTETVLHSFTGGTDGQYPEGALIRDADGNLYGTTVGGGTPEELGTVFEITAAGTELVLYRFSGTDGAQPYGSLIRGKQGDLFGVTFSGGQNLVDCYQGCGVIFQLTPAGTETVLHAFTGGLDGASPYSGLVRDLKGNFYGTAALGANTTCMYSIKTNGCGTVFELTSAGKLKTLYTFTGGSQDKEYPESGLVLDTEGNLYGTTVYGGTSGNGVAYEITP